MTDPTNKPTVETLRAAWLHAFEAGMARRWADAYAQARRTMGIALSIEAANRECGL